MAFIPRTCEHLSGLTGERPAPEATCRECVRTGGQWVHLRTCQACGATLCCDSSPNRHATAHFLATGHPVAASAEPGERWLWCHVHRSLLPY